VTGELDTLDRLLLEQGLEDGAGGDGLVVDLRAAPIVDAASIRALLDCGGRRPPSTSALVVQNGAMRRVLEVAGVGRSFRFTGSLREALGTLGISSTPSGLQS
jgi:anti-anti-sigma regulatory factor